MHRWIAGALSLALLAGCGGAQDNGEEPAEEEQPAAEQAESWEAFQRDYPAFARAYERQQIMLVGSYAQLAALPDLDTSYTVTSTVCGKAVPLQEWLRVSPVQEICDAEITIQRPIIFEECIEEFYRCKAADIDAPCSLSDCIREGS